MPIQSFGDQDTEELYRTGRNKRWGSIARVALRKLDMLHAALTLHDLNRPPGNRLHALQDDRAGQHAIRINDQWRICFRWTPAGPEDVEITDYH